MEEMSKMEKKNMELIATATATSTSEDDQGPSLRSESSSSIGQPDDDDDEEEEEVQSTLSSLASLEDSLPINRRGLSKFYGGKSKSYGNLGEVRSLEDLGKSDNPFNKRRRTILAYNLMFRDHHISTKTSSICRSNSNNKAALFYAHSTHISMPLLPLSEHHDDDDNDNDNDDNGVELDDDYCAAPTRSTSSSSFQFLPSTPPVNATASAAVTPPSSHHTNTNITNANTHTSLV